MNRASSDQKFDDDSSHRLPLITTGVASSESGHERVRPAIPIVGDEMDLLIEGLFPQLLRCHASGLPSHVIQQDRPVVYSVGSDQKDDGARIDWDFGKQPGDFIFKL
jgi:hypothetical protein